MGKREKQRSYKGRANSRYNILKCRRWRCKQEFKATE